MGLQPISFSHSDIPPREFQPRQRGRNLKNSSTFSGQMLELAKGIEPPTC